MKIQKVEKLVDNLHDKIDYAIHIRNFKQALNHELIWKKLRRIIRFKQKEWLKSCIDINTDLREKAKNYFQKYFFQLMNKPVFEKPWKVLESIDMLNLPQQKKGETVWCQYQIIIWPSFSQKIC